MADSDNVIRPIEGKKNVLITSAVRIALHTHTLSLSLSHVCHQWYSI